jgi:hypothetical protein
MDRRETSDWSRSGPLGRDAHPRCFDPMEWSATATNSTAVWFGLFLGWSYRLSAV